MIELIRTLLILLGMVFDIFSTILFYNACLGRKNIRISKPAFYGAFILTFASDLVISNLLPVGLLHLAHSVVFFMILTLVYDSKWISRFFAALSIQVIGMISELISYGIVAATMKNVSFEDVQFYTLMLSKMIIFILAVAAMLIIRKNTRAVRFKDYLYFIITPLISIATVILISFEFDLPSKVKQNILTL